MTHSFRDHHLLALLDAYEQSHSPLDVLMRRYFREHKALGSKDRKEIAETAYSLVRWKGLLDALCSPDCSWEERLECLRSVDVSDREALPGLQAHEKVSFPKDLFDKIEACYGLEGALELCYESNFQAPTTIRVNQLKISREEFMELYGKSYPMNPCPKAPNAVTFQKRENFFGMNAFKEGLFEVQDEGSQLLAQLVEAHPGDHVLDYCSGSGGKTLAVAPRLEGKGQIYLHDIREHALDEAKKRLKRAGVQNAQIVPFDSPKLKKLKKSMDWVLVDAPCSGTGTLRRNPDMKWKYSNDMVQRLVGQQREIFERALSFMKPGGRIVFGTCSLLQEENEQQVEHFLKTYDLELCGEPFKSLPARGGMDGFFAAVFQRSQ